MKSRFLWIFVLCTLCISFAHAQVDPLNLPKISQYVSDFAGVLDSTQRTNLESLAQSYDQQTTNQIVAVLIPNRNGNEIFDIGMKIFKDNQIGQVGKNNGLLLVISTEEKKIRIVVGYGLEGQMPDLLASRIIEEDIRPLVNQGDFAGAIRAFYDRSMSAISTDEASTLQTSSSDNGDTPFWIIGLVIGFIIAILIKSKLKKSGKIYIISGLLFIFVVLTLWLSAIIFVGVIAGLFFGFTGIMPGRGGLGGGGGFGGGGGGFDGGGGDSGGGGAGD